MPGEAAYQRVLQEYLKGELRVLNAHVPRQRKSLAVLLGEEYPHVTCSDGSTHLFKKKDLNYLAGLLADEDRETLMLPMLIEMGAGQDEIAIIGEGPVEEKVVSQVLGMSVTREGARIRLYKPQLALLRKMLKTTTQYIFSHEIVGPVAPGDAW